MRVPLLYFVAVRALGGLLGAAGKRPDLGGRYWDRTSDFLGVNTVPGER
jgi:hypothetical protein